MTTVVVYHDLPIARLIAEKRPEITTVNADSPADAQSALADAEIFITSNPRWDDMYLESLESGNWIQSTSMGYDNFPVEKFKQLNIEFTNAAGNYDVTVSEHVFALLLSFSRDLPRYLSYQEDATWDRSHSLGLTDWEDKRLTILGLGNIGEAVARRALAFEMNVIGIKRDPDAYSGRLSLDQVVSNEEFHATLPQTDVLVITVPLTDDTHHLVDSAVFEALSSEAIVINVARGSVVDEEALIEAVKGEVIGGAGLDVFETEPLPESSPLWGMENVIITPHIGGRADRFADRLVALFLKEYERWDRDEPLTNVVW